MKNIPPSAKPNADALNDIFQLRAFIAKSKLKASLLAPPPPLEEKLPYIEADRRIPVRDGTWMRLRIHSPKVLPKDGGPVFVVYHGGGFCLGDLDSEANMCRKFTELGGVAVNVEYRLAPENPFPIPVLDAYDALKWVRTASSLDGRSIADCVDCRTFRGARRESEKGLPGWRH
jgi:acetyl esterase/lipase